MAKEVQVKKNVGDAVVARVNSLCEAGFTMPKDYNYVNAIKMSMLKLQELKDKNGNFALDVCTPTSIQTALFKMITLGLNAGLNQCFLLIRGNQLCIQESYYGKVLMVKRIYPNWNPVPVVIREGDVFEYAIDPATGKKHIVKHEQKLENIDKDFVGGYLYLPTGDLYIMTKKQIIQAWSKSSSREQAVHHQFSEKMVGKTLVNSGCNMIINSTPEYQMGIDDETNMIENKLPDYEEIDEQSQAEELVEDTSPVEEDKTPQHDEEKSEAAPVKENNNVFTDDEF